MKNYLIITSAILLFALNSTILNAYDNYEDFLADLKKSAPLSTEVYSANDVFLEKYGSNVILANGTIVFFNDIENDKKIAYFKGSGTFIYNPADKLEQKALIILTEKKGMLKEFTEALFFFEDDTYDMLSTQKITGSKEFLNDASIYYDNKLTYMRTITKNNDITLMNEGLSKAFLEPGESKY